MLVFRIVLRAYKVNDSYVHTHVQRLLVLKCLELGVDYKRKIGSLLDRTIIGPFLHMAQ